MARFPRTEPEVVTLAQEMVSGLEDNGVPNPYFPTPPIASAGLTTLLDDYTAARNGLMAKSAVAEQATVEKDDKLTVLVDGMKSDLRYAENAVDYDDEKLKSIGWAGRKTRSPLTAPGQSRLLEARVQGEGDLTLDWRSPIDGGKPNAYRVMRRQRPEGPWSDVATAVTCEVELTDQPRGVEFEYRIVAVNKAGEGEPSNTVVVVL
jgi:fibronectin type III domain protein